MRRRISPSVVTTLFLISLLAFAFSIQPAKPESTLTPSLQLLAGGVKYASREGNSALFVDWTDNYLAHHLTDGVNWTWFPESDMDRYTVPVVDTLEQSGFSVTRAADIPDNLTGYNVVIIGAYYAIEPRHEPLIRDYINNGGGVVLLFGTPTYFGGYCKDLWPYRLGLSNLSPIEEWFGAGFYVNSGAQAHTTIDNPLNTSLTSGDLVYSGPPGGYSAAAVTTMHTDSQVVARWDLGPTFAFIHEYGLGRVYFQATFDEVNHPPPPLNTWSITIASSPTGAGSTSPSGTINVTGRLGVTATPNAGYQFNHWIFDSMNYGSANPILILEQVNGTSHNLTAVFSQRVEPPPPPPPPPPPVYTDVSVVNPRTGDQSFVFFDNATSVGTRFNATVWVSNVTDMYAYQIYLKIDDAVLNITRAWIPAWDAKWVFYGETTISSPSVFFDEDHDGFVEAVLVNDVLLGSDQPRFSGSGLLAIVEFQIIAGPAGSFVPNCQLDITLLQPFATYLLDFGLQEIPIAKTNGQYIFYDPPMLVGDLTFDGKVDIRDLAIAAKAFGSYPGHLRWNPLADINHDEAVDIRDLSMMAKNYGKQLP